MSTVTEAQTTDSEHLSSGEGENEIIYSPTDNTHDFKDLNLTLNEALDNMDKEIKAKDLAMFEADLNKEKSFNTLLKNYVESFGEKQIQNKKLKANFFKCIMVLLFIVTFGCFTIPVLAILWSGKNAENIVTVISSIVASIVEFSVAFLKLPQIVAEYLFDKNEDKSMAKVISKMQEYILKRSNIDK